MVTWRSEQKPVVTQISASGYARAVCRGITFAIIAFVCLGGLMLARIFERPIWGHRRPWTNYIPQYFGRLALIAMGVRYRKYGKPMDRPGAVVANHLSWIDIFALNAGISVFFVAKSEVAEWPVINWFSQAAGTIHINRRRMEAATQKKTLEDRLCAGNRLLFFPEGTSTDGSLVLPFKSTLFAPFFIEEIKNVTWIQPATVIYRAPEGEDPGLYCWWGDMDLGTHLLKVLSARRQGIVEVTFHPPLRVADYADRKALALACEEVVREGMTK